MANPDLLARYFFGQLLYDVSDDASGIHSAMRGHSLSRLQYGFQEGSNSTPFNGTGRLRGPSPFPAVDNYHLINYTYFPRDGFLRDPERLGWRANHSQPRGLYTGGFNPPYTYPDLNNMFLAAVKADGTVLIPSFHRPWLFNPGRALNDPTNPNWTNSEGKYLILRPRPIDMGPGFPYPSDPNGDVKNLIDSPGGNDSVWMDLDFPVLTMPNGLKFKPLFAPLIIDLDGKVNVNVHGNIRARLAQGEPAHASNQGWGPWEVNLGHVLNRQINGVDEWPNLFLGSAAAREIGRYGLDGKPGSANSQAPAAPWLHFYAQGDYDACRVQGDFLRTDSSFLLPGRGALALQCFPSFPPGYDNLSGDTSQSERWEHPSLYNVYRRTGDDRFFDASNLEDLLCHAEANVNSQSSPLWRLCRQNFADPRLRRLVTTHSFDIDGPGVTPWVYDPRQSGYVVPANAPTEAPLGPPLPFPALALRTMPVPPHSEFGAPLLPPTSPGVDWRALSAALQRVDLNRRLTPYPLPSPQTTATHGQRFDVPQFAGQFQQAQLDRQQLAGAIYDRLLSVVGVPRSASIANQPSPEELQVRRWLAQLAVNIVDFLDEDDITTPFNFYTNSDAEFLPFDIGAVGESGSPPAKNPDLPLYWVFGTELPHVVLNEVLAEYKEQPNTANATLTTTVKTWVELHNPFQVPQGGQRLQPQDGFPVPLRIDAVPNSTVGKNQAYAPFQVVLATGLVPRSRNENGLGAPDVVRTATTDGDFAGPVQQMDGNQQPAPSPSIKTQSFFLLGPPGQDEGKTLTPAPTGTVPAATPWLQSTSLEYQRDFAPNQREEKDAGLTVLLRRLANPHLPFDSRPSMVDMNGDMQPNPWYNPYVTIDYLERVPLHNVTSGGNPHSSRGKRQPYAAHPDQIADQVSPRATQPTQHTLGLPNNPIPQEGHYEWLVHLDRELISPMELLHVSGYQPYQLTQQFLVGNGQGIRKFQHYVPWFDQTRRLYRVFEFLETRSRMAGAQQSPGGRIAGKINLNTIWDPETFLALCDPGPGNGPQFTRAEVLRIYQEMLALRSPGLASGDGPGPADRPFLGLATGYSLQQSANNPDIQHPNRGRGINDTLLRALSASADASPGGGASLPRLFEIPAGQHPYHRHELLTKIFNNVTTRSNVFAIWVTVGFFEVVDDSTQPVRLGPELGRETNRQFRHRFFAIVDRSAIQPEPSLALQFDPRRNDAVLHFVVLE